MAHRVVVAGRISPGMGPWVRVAGGECSVRITALAPGETVRIHTRPPNGTLVFDSVGVHAWTPRDCTHYAFEKVSTLEDSLPTIIEVELP